MIDPKRLLADLEKLLPSLELDLRERVAATSELEAEMRARWSEAKAAGRTAETIEEFTEDHLTQVAVAWVLGCVFVRFLDFDRARKGGRLTGRSLHRIVRELGTAAGLKVRPHGLRHAAITEGLDLTRGDVRKVQRFSRHRDLRVLNRYDDNRQDLGGEVARFVAAGAGA